MLTHTTSRHVFPPIYAFKHTYTHITTRKLNVLLSSCESKLQETQNIQFITIGNLSSDWCLSAVYKCAAHVFFGFVWVRCLGYVLHGIKGAVAEVNTIPCSAEGFENTYIYWHDWDCMRLGYDIIVCIQSTEWEWC